MEVIKVIISNKTADQWCQYKSSLVCLHAFTLQNYKTVNASLDRTKGKIKKKGQNKGRLRTRI